MPLDIEALLAPDDELDAPANRAALAASLRRQQQLGTIAQMMNIAPATKVGTMLQENAGDTLRQALAKQQQARARTERTAERTQQQQNADRTFTQSQAEATERTRQFNAQEARLRAQQQAEAKRRFQHAVDPVTGQMRLYDIISGKWADEGGAAPPGGPGAVPPGQQPQRPPGFGSAPPGLKATESQDKSRLFGANMAQSLPVLEQAIADGYQPSYRDLLAAGPAMTGMAGTAQNYIPRVMASETGRKFYTEGRAVLAAILRKESGAAITDDEWSSYGPVWLPWPGESKEESARKLQRLRVVMGEIASGAGPAAHYWQAPPLPGARGGQRVTAPGGGAATAQPGAAGAQRNFDAEYGVPQ